MKKKDTLEKRLETAGRLRQIRESIGLTQDKFSEILEISESGYKKIESGENQISLINLRKLYQEIGVSADFILFGKNEGLDDTWKAILNCSEADKLFLMLRLLDYFTKIRKGTFLPKEEASEGDNRILQLYNWLRNNEE